MRNIISVKINLIKPNPKNPRIIRDATFKKLVESIKAFPKMLNIRPIVVNSEMIVLGGNMRLRACQEAGLKEVPIIKADDLTESEQKQFIVKDNVQAGEWDWDLIANEWNPSELSDWGLDVPNFEPFGEIEARGRMAKSLEEMQDTYMNMVIKQIVLYYEFEEYEKVLIDLKKICEENNLSDNSVAVKFLVDRYLKK